MDRFFRWFNLPGSFVLTLLMSAFAFVLALIFPSPARWLCFAAMAFSSVGDIFLMRFRGLDRIFPNYFVIGAAFFMLAHLLYTGCFALRIRGIGAAYLNGGAVIALVIAAVCFAYFTKLCMEPGRRSQYPLILAYLIIISINCMSVFSYAWSSAASHPAAILAAVGALSFLLSDLIIGLGMAADIRKYDHLIWWLYPIGQILLIAGVGK